MAVLLTGGSGFIGKALTDRFKTNNIPYYAPSSTVLNITKIGSIRQFLKEHADIDAFINAAADVNFSNAERAFYTNVYGTNLLFRCMYESGIKYGLFTSGNNVYGSSERNLKETDALRTDINNIYAISKSINESDIASLAKEFNAECCIVRISDVYGAGFSQGNLLKAYTASCRENTPLYVYGAGKRVRDYISVDDVAEGIVLLLEKRIQGIFNLSTGIGTSVRQMAETFRELSDYRVEIVDRTTEKEDISRIVLDCGKLNSLGFYPKISLREGISKLITSCV